MTQRILARVSDDVGDKLTEWSKKLAVSKAQLAGMSITAGLDAILRAVSPMDAITPAQWARVIQEMEKNKPKMDVSGGENGESQ